MPIRPPDPLDLIIGQQIRVFRRRRGLTQTELGRAIGVTFQQIQKYENARNRISAARLYQLSKVLAVPLTAFFLSPENDRAHNPLENSF